MKYLKLFLFFLLCNTQLFSQTKISGTISDSISSESLVGALISIKDLNKNYVTDIDGKFQFTTSPGKHQLEFSFLTYKKIYREVIINNGDSLNLDIKLVPEINEIQTITVIATSNKASVAELNKIQKNSSVVVDGTTSESFKKTPDSKASDVFKRISGTTVQDNKFVIIRGLNDRYNFGLLNGSTLPSSESDRKAFSFDIFPSNMIDNILIYKSARPDLPGEFAGGIIDITTTEPKDESVNNIQISGSFNTITTNLPFTTYQSGPTDFLGFGSRYRQLPKSIPTTQDFSTLTRIEKAKYAVLMDYSWNTYKIKAPLNSQLQMSFGRNYKFGRESNFAYVLVYNYQNNFSTNTLIRREFEESSDGVILKMELKDSVFTKNVLNSGLLNFTYNINSKHSIKFKNIYSVNSEDKVNVRKGVRELDNDPRQWEKSTNFWYTQNNLSTHQLIGYHQIFKTKLDWNLGFSDVKRQIPNLRRIIYRKYSYLEDDTTQQYVAVIQTNGTLPTAAGNMFWSDCKEKIWSGKINWSVDFGPDNFKTQFKTGGFIQQRQREFTSRNLGFSQYKPNGSFFNSEILTYSPDSIFSSENLGQLKNGKGGFKLEESTKVDDSYQATSQLRATYAMIDSKIFEKLRITGGLRLESYHQVFNYKEDGSFVDKTIDTTIVDYLPSINLSYDITDKFKIRSSYYKTVSRPEFRELAPFAFYNFILDNIVSGNPYLKRSTIDNYDVRAEFYPSPTEIISISGFHKAFFNPIEMINRTGTSGAPELYYSNVPMVKNIGVELEFRKKLTIIPRKESCILNGFTIWTNFSYINSKVFLQDFVGSDSIRPLQGQSPYIINSGLYWSNHKNTSSFGFSYNIIGPRIWIVGNVQEPSVWEKGRNVLDFQISQKIKKFEFKLSVKDILAQKLIYFQDLNKNQKFDDGDNNWQQSTFGQTMNISIKYSF